MLLGLPAGVLVDRWPKKRMLVGAALVEASAVATLPLCYLLDCLALWQLLAVAATVSLTTLLFDTAHSAILPPLVGPTRVSEASARLQTADGVLRVIGPGVAGQALRVVSGPLLYVVTAGLGAVSALISSTIRLDEPRRAETDRDPFLKSLLGGIKFVVGHPVLRTFMLASAFINLGAGMFMAIMPVFVLRQLSVPAATWGLAIAVGAVGGIGASLIGLRIKLRVGELRTMLILDYLLPAAFGAAALAGILPVPPIVLVALSEFLFGVIIVVYTICSTGVRARVTPQSLFGRVSSASRFVTLGVLPVGALLGGAVASAAGDYAGLALAVACAMGAPISFTASPLRTSRHLPTHWELASRER